MAPAWLAFYDGIIALVLFVFGTSGAYFGFLNPFTGFQMAFVWSLLISVIGVIVGLYAQRRYRAPGFEALRRRATVGLWASALVLVPVLILVARGMIAKVPPINDITTDFDNPPEFVAIESLPATAEFPMKYDKVKYADRQLAGYGVLAPLKERGTAADTFAKVKEVAAQVPSWKIAYSDDATMTLEGYSTSKLFRFPDYFVIKVQPSSDGGSLIQMRSKSRYGIGDFGINYRRIHNFFDRIALARENPGEEIP